MPVSYTHLDVYKRQVSGFVRDLVPVPDGLVVLVCLTCVGRAQNIDVGPVGVVGFDIAFQFVYERLMRLSWVGERLRGVCLGHMANYGRASRCERDDRASVANPVEYRAAMPDRNRRFLLRERPTGHIGPDTFELNEQAVPEIGDGEALVRVDWISLDPTNRAWINDTPTYLPPVGIGEVMRAGGLGEVVASKNPNYPVGQTVQGLVGWQEYAVLSDGMFLFPVDVAEGVSPLSLIHI